MTPLFLDISSAVSLRRTQEKQLSFATFLFCFGKRKVEEETFGKEKMKNKKSNATLQLIRKMGIFRASAHKSTGLAHILGSGKRKVKEETFGKRKGEYYPSLHSFRSCEKNEARKARRL